MRSETDNPLLEVVLHSGEDYVLEGFRDYLLNLDVPLNLDRRIRVQVSAQRGAAISSQCWDSRQRAAACSRRAPGNHGIGLADDDGLSPGNCAEASVFRACIWA
jgi:hypothetical protein